MKYLKRFFLTTTIPFALMMTPCMYADNLHDMQPNKIPETIVFHLNQTGDEKATLFFSNASLPAQFLCYFTSTNNLQVKGLTAHISSDSNKIDFLDNNNTMLVGKSDVKMFTVSRSGNNVAPGKVEITLDINKTVRRLGQTVNMICTMDKIINHDAQNH